MGMLVDKAKLVGLFGGYTTSKTGRHFLAILSPGPKVNKVEIPSALALPPGIEFGTKIEVSLTQAEQKFSDFSNTFATAQSAQITVVK
jgi:hypothetical protein